MCMTLIFGLMGLIPFITGNPEKYKDLKPEMFMDMAKLFAGVIIGGAAGATTSAIISPRKPKGA